MNRAKGKFQVPKEPKDVQDKADKAIKDALGKVPDAIHFNRQGKRTTATLYVGNLEFKASTKELKDVLDRVFKKIHVEDVVIPLKDGRSCGYGCNVYEVNTWLWNFGRGNPCLGGLTVTVEETSMRKKTVKKDQAKRSAETRRRRREDGA